MSALSVYCPLSRRAGEGWGEGGSNWNTLTPTLSRPAGEGVRQKQFFIN